MSLEQANQFVEKLLENHTFRCQIAQCSSIDERLSVARSNGYDVDIDDFIKLSEKLMTYHEPHISSGLVNNDSRGNVCYTYSVPGPSSVLVEKNINRTCHIIIRSPQ